MRAGPAVLALLIFVVGCSGQAPKPVKPKQPEINPDSRVYEMLREGSFKMNTASESLNQALNSSLSIQKGEKPGSTRFDHLDEIVSLVDEAGNAVSDFTKAPQSLDAVKENFSKFDDRRLDAIAAGNDAIRRLSLAGRHANALGESKRLSELRDLLGLAQQEVEEAVVAFGGTVDEPS